MRRVWLRCLALAALALVGACGASTRDLPSDVSPTSNRSGPAIAFVDDAGVVKAHDAGRTVASTKPKNERTDDEEPKRCAVRARATSPNDYLVARGMREALQGELGRGDSVTSATDAQGQIRGLLINNATPCIEELGFAAGDVITSINGIDISASAAWTRIYESIVQQSNASATVERNGAVIELRYRLLL